MSIYEKIYDTLDMTPEEAFAIIGGSSISSIILRRDKMKAYLEDNKWDEVKYKEWLRLDITKKNKSKGLGDTVAKITRAVGIKPCGGCKKRQAKLNKLIPYKGA